MKRRQFSAIRTEEKSGLPLFHNKLLTLWDMKEYAASLLVHIGSHLAFVKEDAAYHQTRQGGWPKQNRLQSQAVLREALPWLEKLGLNTTRHFFSGFADELDRLSIDGAKHKADSVREVWVTELRTRQFFVLDPDDARYFNNTVIAGEDFKLKFPKANGELIEAGNCFALGRWTGCVCHLMRSLEYVLAALENKLNIPVPTNPADRTWGRALGRISEKKGESGKRAASAEWLQDASFYDDCCIFLASVKSAYRDKTFHVESVYDALGAKSVFDASVITLQHISKKLNEVK